MSVHCDLSYVEESYNQMFLSTCESGDLNRIRELAKDKRVNPSSNENEALRTAIENGRNNIIRLLTQCSRVRRTNNLVPSLIIAVKKGYMSTLMLFVDDPVMKLWENQELWLTLKQYGHPDVFN